MVGRIGKAMRQFIDSIPDSKLEGGIRSGTIHTDYQNFRLDNQGYTTVTDDKPLMYNIQMQVNNYPKLTSLAAMAPNSIATVEVPVYEPTFTAVQIKALLVADLVRRNF